MSSADRGLKILSLFTREQPEWTVEQAAQALKATISTTYRYFATLTRAGLISSERGGKYILGPAILQLDWILRETDPLLLAAQSVMEHLTQLVDRPAVVLLCRLYRGQVMCVDQVSAHQPSFASGYQRGRPRPLFRGAASKIILANMPDRTIKSMLTNFGADMAEAQLGFDWASVRGNLRAIREKGYAVTFGEVDSGLIGMGAPILLRDGAPIGSLSYVISDDGVAAEHVEALATHLVQGARQIGFAQTA